MKTRFQKRAKIFDIIVTTVAGMMSVGFMLYGIGHFGLHLLCLTLSMLLILLLTFFYARRDWKSYTKGNLWVYLCRIWSPSTSTPTICSPKSEFAPPSPTASWPAS